MTFSATLAPSATFDAFPSFVGSPRAARGPCQNKNNSPRPSGAAEPTGPKITLAESEFMRNAPRSVWACMFGDWSFLTVHKQTGAREVRPFRCKSWRCPNCRNKVAAGDFVRMLESFRSRKSWDDCILLTLTFNPGRTGKWEAYSDACRAFQKLRQRLARWYGSKTAPASIRYVAVWEQHQSGYPHAHIAIDCAELAFDVRSRGQSGWLWYDAPDGRKMRTPKWAWKRQVLDELAVACGFGVVSDVQFPRRDEGGVAGYFLKMSAELVGMFDQTPSEAPRGFRRLRASQRTLPPRHRSTGEFDGALVQDSTERLNRFLERWEADGATAGSVVAEQRRASLCARLRLSRRLHSGASPVARVQARERLDKWRVEHPPPSDLDPFPLLLEADPETLERLSK